MVLSFFFCYDFYLRCVQLKVRLSTIKGVTSHHGLLPVSPLLSPMNVNERSVQYRLKLLFILERVNLCGLYKEEKTFTFNVGDTFKNNKTSSSKDGKVPRPGQGRQLLECSFQKLPESGLCLSGSTYHSAVPWLCENPSIRALITTSNRSLRLDKALMSHARAYTAAGGGGARCGGPHLHVMQPNCDAGLKNKDGPWALARAAQSGFRVSNVSTVRLQDLQRVKGTTSADNKILRQVQKIEPRLILAHYAEPWVSDFIR